MTDTPNTPEPNSNCHQAPLKVITGDEGTSYWICTECKQPADPHTPEPVDTELDEQLDKQQYRLFDAYGTAAYRIYRGDAAKPPVPEKQFMSYEQFETSLLVNYYLMRAIEQQKEAYATNKVLEELESLELHDIKLKDNQTIRDRIAKYKEEV